MGRNPNSGILVLKKTVIVTGATGFIGRHTISRLVARGYTVHALTSRSINHTQDCHWHQVDLLDPLATAEIINSLQASHLLHLAWYAVPGKYWSSIENLRWVQASLELVRHFHEAGGERVVVAGSCAEYDWQHGYCSESLTPRQPNSLYGVCKNSLQEILQSYSTVSGLSSTWGRIFMLYGSHEFSGRLVASIIRSLLQGQEANCSHGRQIRDFMYVEDVADAFIALLDSKVAGTINISTGVPITIKEVATQIATIMGRPELLKLGAVAATANDVPLLVGNADRLHNELNWQPQWSIEQGLEQTIQWWRQQELGRKQ
jgi:nucleoside-diphosphate-sugar epimerase